jgi:hypothetical protein
MRNAHGSLPPAQRKVCNFSATELSLSEETSDCLMQCHAINTLYFITGKHTKQHEQVGTDS